jgi:hypothetical protein
MWSLLRFEKVAEFGNFSGGFDDFAERRITFSEVRLDFRDTLASVSEELNSSSSIQALSA